MWKPSPYGGKLRGQFSWVSIVKRVCFIQFGTATPGCVRDDPAHPLQP